MITDSLIKSFFKVYAPSKHKALEIEISERVKVHSEGKYPKKLVDSLRPNEPEIVKAFRKLVYKSHTKAYFDKIYTLLQKIAKAEDFAIQYPEFVGAVLESENIKTYLTKNYPEFDSLENYIFTILLRNMLEDANGVIVVIPKDFVLDETTFYEPFAFFYETEKVLKLSSELLVIRTSDKGPKEDYLFIDKEEIAFITVDKTDFANVVYNKISYANTLNKIPAFKIGGIIKKVDYKTELEDGNIDIEIDFLYDSFIYPSLDKLDEAARLYSDHQANLIQHIYPEKYIYQTSECKTCSGSGKLRIPNSENDTLEILNCNSCKGSGYASSPYGIHEIIPNNNPSQNGNVPTPPIGYVSKPVELVKVLREEIDLQCKEALSALGLEFLHEIPANQSGIAKVYDREEINTFIATVARHLIENVVKPIIYYTMEWRYGLILSEEQIAQNTPIVRVPKKFDSLTNELLAQRLQNAVKNNLDYFTRKQIEIDYAIKEFGNDSEIVKKLKTLMLFDALGGKTEDEKMTILANRGVSQIDYVISSNLHHFINRAMNEFANFLDLSYSEKRAIFAQYANEIIQTIPNQIPLQ